MRKGENMASVIETPESAEAVRARLLALKQETGMSWPQIAAQSGIKSGTISSWAGGTYGGDVLGIAADVRRFLDGRAALAMLKPGQLKAPGFVETPTADRLITLFQWAQTGEIVAVAAGPGTGKTTAALEYQTRAPNVWLATMSPSASGVQPMQMAVCAAMGLHDAKGSPQQLSALVLSKCRNSNGLIIIDEAQEVSEKALDEIRSWHDKTGIGIALVGDERVIGRLGGIRRAELARLHSRVSMRHIQAFPDQLDANAVIRAWGIDDAGQVRFLTGLARKPGGLRGIAKTIKLASMMAAGEDRAVSLADLQEAWAQRNTETMGG